MNEWMSGLTDSNEQLIGLVLTIMALVFIVSILRSVFRMVMPLLVIGLIMVVFLGFTPIEVIDKGKQILMNGSQIILDHMSPFIQQDNYEIEKGEKGETGETGVPPEHDPYQDGEGVPGRNKDILKEDENGMVNQL
ncbi:hypothetical protein [Niallia sp. Krafla_26]|uniref:hypothetical protein n=1 Tax=Niallia sp. Krafla_26 TaxID=3064703 RepID=UPI003D1754C6